MVVKTSYNESTISLTKEATEGFKTPLIHNKKGSETMSQDNFLTLFSQHKDQEVLGYPLNWLAINRDQSIFTEFEVENNEIVKRNSFYDIHQPEVRMFGIYGNGYNFYFDKANGNLYVNNVRYDVEYHVKGLKYQLTDNINHKDLISFKEGYTDRDEDRDEQEVVLDGVSVGYKTEYRMREGWINVQFIMNASLSDTASLEVKLTSPFELDGALVFKRSNQEVESFKAPLKANTSGLIKWEIKER